MIYLNLCIKTQFMFYYEYNKGVVGGLFIVIVKFKQ